MEGRILGCGMKPFDQTAVTLALQGTLKFGADTPPLGDQPEAKLHRAVQSTFRLVRQEPMGEHVDVAYLSEIPAQPFQLFRCVAQPHGIEK